MDDQVRRLYSPPEQQNVKAYGAERWAEAMVRAVSYAGDLKNIRAWACAIGTSKSTLTTWCKAGHARTKPSLDLARLLRAIRLAADLGWDLPNLLDVVDDRTLLRLLKRGHVEYLRTTLFAPSVHSFLEEQTFIRDTTALAALSRHLRDCDLLRLKPVVEVNKPYRI
jgi:hypothetical protein